MDPHFHGMTKSRQVALRSSSLRGIHLLEWRRAAPHSVIPVKTGIHRLEARGVCLPLRHPDDSGDPLIRRARRCSHSVIPVKTGIHRLDGTVSLLKWISFAGLKAWE